MALEMRRTRDIVEITLPDEYNLFYTFMSSFACYLFALRKEDLNNSEWLGLVRPFEGVLLRQSGKTLQYEFPQPIAPTIREYLIRDVTGLWYEPKPITTDDRAARIVDLLSDRIFPGVRVPRLRLSKWEILTSILFSIHAKVPLSRAWFASLYGKMGNNWRKLIGMPPSEIMALTARDSGQSAGFRARYLVGAIRDLYQQYPGSEDPLQTATETSNLKLRMRLLRVYYIGPKVADCFLLNAMGDVSTPPVDVNVYRVVQNLGILPPFLGLPSAELCMAYACTPEQSQAEAVPLCPKAERTIALLEGKTQSVSGTCVRSALTLKFSDAGWVQALLFLYGQRYCTRNLPSCRSCELKDFSLTGQISDMIPVKTRSAPRPRPLPIEPFIPENIPVFTFYPKNKEDCLNYMGQMYRLVREKGSPSGRGIKAFLAAFLWLATKQYRIPALVDEIADAYEVEREEMLNASSSIRSLLELNPPNTQASAYIERLQKVLLFSDDVLEQAIKVASNYSQFHGRRPESVAAASLYITLRGTRRPVTIKTISESLGVTEVTVRNSVKTLDGVSECP
jgi:endonuclease III